jgi:hypothetical protein
MSIMKTKPVALVVILLVAMIVGVLVLSRKPSPVVEEEAQVVSVSGPVDEIPEGQSWGVYVTVTANKPGTYRVTASFEGEEGSAEVYIPAAGAENTCFISFRGRASGVYTYKIGGREYQVKFRPPIPATFVVEDVKVYPAETTTNRKVEVTVTVKNVGELEGTFENQTQVESLSKTIGPQTLGPGERVELKATLTPADLESLLGGKDAKEVKVKVGDKEAVLKLRKPKPAQLEYIALSAPKKAYRGENFVIKVVVKNVGDLENKFELQATVGNNSLTKTSPKLAGGQEWTWPISYTPTESGSLTVKAGDFTSIITVVEPPPVVVEELKVPRTIVVGDKLEVTLVLKNRTGERASADVQLLVEGPQAVSPVYVTDQVGPGEKLPVSKSFTLTKEGIYTVSAETKSETVRVLNPRELNVVGDASVGRVEAIFEVAVLNWYSKSTSTKRTVYQGIQEYKGYQCMVWRSEDVEKPEMDYGVNYSVLSDGDKVLKQVETISRESEHGSVTTISYDPPLKIWTYPLQGFSGEQTKMSVIWESASMGARMEASVKASASLEDLGTELVWAEWGEQVKTRHIKITIKSIEPANVVISSGGTRLTGTADVTITIERWEGVKDDWSMVANFTVSGYRGTLIFKTTTETLYYKSYWWGEGGDPSYKQYLS